MPKRRIHLWGERVGGGTSGEKNGQRIYNKNWKRQKKRGKGIEGGDWLLMVPGQKSLGRAEELCRAALVHGKVKKVRGEKVIGRKG